MAVTVSAPNQPPNAVNDYYSLTTADNAPMSFVANVRANGASTAVVRGSVTVTNLPVGNTVFSYTISDGHGGTDTGSVTISRTYEPSWCGGPGQPICP